MLAKLVRPYHLKLFISNKHIHATIISKVDNSCVLSADTNNRVFRKILGEYASKNDDRACEEVAKALAVKAFKKQVDSLFWDGVVSQKTSKKSLKNKGKLVWETLGKVAPHLRLSFSQKDEEIEEREEKADKDPVTPKALEKPSKLDPNFRRAMWRLMAGTHQARISKLNQESTA